MNTLNALGIATLLVAALTACSSNKDDSKAQGGNPEQEKAVNVTSYEKCDQGTPTFNLMGRWQQDLQSEEFRFRLTLEIQDGMVSMSNQCFFKGETLVAQVRAPAEFSPTAVRVLGSDEDTQSIDKPGLQMNCRINIRPQTMTYEFRGSCLALTDTATKETHVFIPAY